MEALPGHTLPYYLTVNALEMKFNPFILLFVLLLSCQSEEQATASSVETPAANSSAIDLADYVGGDYLIDDQHSYLGFKIKYFGFSPVRGRFDEFDGTLFYDPDHLDQLSVSIFVDATSINTGNERRDSDLQKEGSWFHAARFPVLSFVSKEVLPQEDGDFALIGDLTIKGVTLPDTFHFDAPTPLSKDWAANDQVDFSGRTTINRQDFGVFGGDFWSSVMENGLTQLSDEVEIELDMHCRRPDYPARYKDTDSLDIGRAILDQIRAEGLEAGLVAIDSIYQADQLSAGKLSTIGYTLNAWGQHEEARSIFEKRRALFPDLRSTWNQLGITALLLNDQASAQQLFEQAWAADSTDSRAHAYLQLLQADK